MKPEIKNILYSQRSYTIGAIQEMVSKGVVDKEELTALLGDSIVRDLLKPSQVAPEPLSVGGLYEPPKQNNIITLWGVPSSGRTSIIASLLSLKGMTPIKPNHSDDTSCKIRSKIEAMSKVFQCLERYQALPEVGSGSPEVYHAKYKHQWRSYNLSFLKACLEDWDVVNTVLESNQRQIHIFCIDCRQDIGMQVEEHKQVIELLSNHLSYAVGMYVLVTKCDMMNCPELYLENAAQTLVTASGASELWRLIRNKCKANLIYNEQPIVSSVGDFVLKDYAQLRSDYTQRLCDDFIIPKCEHNHWGVVKLLKMGSKGMAALVILLIISLLGFGGYQLFSMLGKDPTTPLKPYDYTNNFVNDIGIFLNEDAIYESACEVYDSLRFDLNVERSLKTKNGDSVLPNMDYFRCDSTLTNAFSSIMIKRMQMHFNSDAWSQDSAFMAQALPRLNELYSHRDHMEKGNDSVCVQYRKYLLCYRDSIKMVINTMDLCKSINDVDVVVKVAKCWAGEYPFCNDSHLDSLLYDAPRQAYCSCKKFFEESAESLLEESNDNGYEKSNFWGIKKYVRYEQNIDDIISLRSCVVILYNKVEADNQEGQYDDLIKELNELYDKLNNALPEEDQSLLMDLKRRVGGLVDMIRGLFD